MTTTITQYQHLLTLSQLCLSAVSKTTNYDGGDDDTTTTTTTTAMTNIGYSLAQDACRVMVEETGTIHQHACIGCGIQLTYKQIKTKKRKRAGKKHGGSNSAAAAVGILVTCEKCGTDKLFTSDDSKRKKGRQAAKRQYQQLPKHIPTSLPNNKKRKTLDHEEINPITKKQHTLLDIAEIQAKKQPKNQSSSSDSTNVNTKKPSTLAMLSNVLNKNNLM
jgi:hypothetical protein